MKSYKLLFFSYPAVDNQFQFSSSHQDVLEWLGGEAQKIVPTCRIDYKKGSYRTCYLSKIDKRACEMYEALFRLVLDSGWEPFQYDYANRYHLRLEINT